MNDGKRGLEENVANVKMLPIVNTNVANWKLGIGIGNNGNNGNT